MCKMKNRQVRINGRLDIEEEKLSKLRHSSRNYKTEKMD